MQSSNFRAAREAKFPLQTDAAQALRISPEVLSRIEGDKQLPGRNLLVRMADLYGCSVDFLLGREPGTAPLAADAKPEGAGADVA